MRQRADSSSRSWVVNPFTETIRKNVPTGTAGRYPFSGDAAEFHLETED